MQKQRLMDSLSENRDTKRNVFCSGLIVNFINRVRFNADAWRCLASSAPAALNRALRRSDPNCGGSAAVRPGSPDRRQENCRPAHQLACWRRHFRSLLAVAPRVHQRNTRLKKIIGIARDDCHAMNQRGCSDQRITFSPRIGNVQPRASQSNRLVNCQNAPCKLSG